MHKSLVVKDGVAEQFKSGYPLILKEYIVNWDSSLQEGDILNLVDSMGKFLAKGYYGEQNKGHGWVLTLDKNEPIDVKFFKTKIKQALNYRESYFADSTTTAFRVFNGEGDGVGGLSIDYFDGFYLVTWYSIGIYRFKDDIIAALQDVANPKGVYQKKRFNTKGMYLNENDDFVCGKEAPAPIIVKENGVNFAIYLDDGAMVGVFLDQKDVRKTIRDKYAKEKVVLNTFSYTGAFSVYAALGGAKSTTSVDLAKRSLAKTKEQFSINGIDLNKQKIIVDDVFDYFKYAVRKKLRFDLVIVDPPSFARSKKRTFSASKDYTKLLKEIIEITNQGGVIVASTNAANFNMRVFEDFVKKAFNQAKVEYKILEKFSLSKDFRVNKNFLQSNYLKVLFIRLLA